jgi:DNA polymerase-3 subunit delta
VAVELSKPPKQKTKQFLIYWEEYQSLTPAETVTWLQNEAVKRQGKIEQTAAQHLQYLIGNDLFRLQNELAKLLAYANGRAIAKKDVETLVDAVLQEEVFKFIEAIGQKNRGLASESLIKQLLAGVNELQLLSLITRNFRILIQIQDLLNRAHGEYLPPAKVATLINEHPFAVQKSYNQLRHFDLPTLQQIYQQLLLTEQKIKTSQATPEVLLGLLVTKLTSL